MDGKTEEYHAGANIFFDGAEMWYDFPEHGRIGGAAGKGSHHPVSPG
jgi:hypothetical protein